MRPARALKPGMGLIANRAYAAPAGGSGDALAHAIPISPGLLVQLTHPAERMRLAEP
jgi:hypothetical protein